MTDEWYLYTRLKLHGVKANTFDGVTDFEQRRERARAAIVTAHLEAEECWRVRGVTQSFAEAFRSVYAEFL